jgi:uncharacterized protein YndB with AHSA1/START domain
MKRPVTALPGGVAVIEAEADIRRPAEEVFDYACDPANEPGWNIRAKRIQKLNGGPVGVGARYRVEFTRAPAVISECVRFERPRLWEHAAGQMSWAFVLEPVDETSTRLITRSRGAIDRLALGLMLKVFWHPLDFGMQRRQLLNLKRLVETA